MAQGVAHSRRGAPDRPQDEDGDTVRGRAERAPWAPSPYLMIWGVPSGGQVGIEDPTRTRSGCMSSFPQWKRMAMRKFSKLRKPLAADLSAWMTEL